MSYAYAHRFVDYSATKENMRRAILRFIYGLRGKRENPVTLRQIERYFRATPPEFTRKTVDDLIDRYYLVILRTGLSDRAGYVYEQTNMGNAYMYGDTVWDTPRGREIYEPTT